MEIIQNQIVEETKLVDFYENIIKSLNTNQKINLLDLERLKYYNGICSQSDMSGSNLEKKINSEKLNILKEKALTLLKDKKSHDIVQDYYFLMKNDDIYKQEMNKRKKISNYQEISEKKRLVSNLHSTKYDQYIENSHYLSDLLVFTSNQFLSKEIGLTDDQIKKIKGNVDNENTDIFTIQTNTKIQKNKEVIKNSTTENLIQEAENLKINSLKKKEGTKTEEKIINKITDRNLEEDLNNEIFHYTKNMKKMAYSFSNILENDNMKLGKIEEKASKDQTKTTQQLKSLNQFQQSIKIGICQLIMMFAFVLISFVFVLVIIRIFPKFI